MFIGSGNEDFKIFWGTQFSSWPALWNYAKEFNFVLGALGLSYHVPYSPLSCLEKSVSLSTISRWLRVSGCLLWAASTLRGSLFNATPRREQVSLYGTHESTTSQERKTLILLMWPIKLVSLACLCSWIFEPWCKSFYLKLIGENLMIPNHFESGICHLNIVFSKLHPQAFPVLLSTSSIRILRPCIPKKGDITHKEPKKCITLFIYKL